MSRKRALLIGCNYAGTPNELHGCINDVNNVAALLQSFKYSVVMMKDDGSVAANLYPSRENILTQMKSFARESRPNDRLFVHYSGHGTSLQDDGTDEDTDNRDEAICPATGNIIRDDEIRASLINRLPSSVSLVMLLDCCHSGTGADLRYNYHDTSQYIAGGSTPASYTGAQWRQSHRAHTNYRQAETKAAVTCISGCEDSQTSADASFNGRSEGAMTRCFLEAWAECVVNGVARLDDLYKSMSCRLRCYRFSQRPQLSLGNRANFALFEQKRAYILL